MKTSDRLRPKRARDAGVTPTGPYRTAWQPQPAPLAALPSWLARLRAWLRPPRIWGYLERWQAVRLFRAQVDELVPSVSMALRGSEASRRRHLLGWEIVYGAHVVGAALREAGWWPPHERPTPTALPGPGEPSPR